MLIVIVWTLVGFPNLFYRVMKRWKFKMISWINGGGIWSWHYMTYWQTDLNPHKSHLWFILPIDKPAEWSTCETCCCLFCFQQMHKWISSRFKMVQSWVVSCKILSNCLCLISTLLKYITVRRSSKFGCMDRRRMEVKKRTNQNSICRRKGKNN